MNAGWQAKTVCRKCAAAVIVSLASGDSDAPGLAIFYCPVCGERTQVEVPAGIDLQSIDATSDAG